MCLPLMSTTAVPSLQMTCGLFNTGSSTTHVPSMGSLDEAMDSLEATNVFSQFLDNDGELFDAVDPWPLDDVFPLVAAELPDNFYEEYADLSNDNFMSLDSSSVTQGQPDVATEVPIQLSSTVDLAAVEPVEVPPDHGDYTVKTPRQIAHVERDRDDGSKSTTRDRCQDRRTKNNEASRRSRQLRKRRNAEIEQTADMLERENAILKERVAKMEAAAKEMREDLIKRIAQKK